MRISNRERTNKKFINTLVKQWGKYEVVPSDEDIHEAYTVIFTGYEEELYADSEEEAHEIAIEFLLRQRSK